MPADVVTACVGAECARVTQGTKINVKGPLGPCSVWVCRRGQHWAGAPFSLTGIASNSKREGLLGSVNVVGLVSAPTATKSAPLNRHSSPTISVGTQPSITKSMPLASVYLAYNQWVRL